MNILRYATHHPMRSKKKKDGPRMKFEVKKDEEEWIPLDVAAGSSSNSVVQIAEK